MTYKHAERWLARAERYGYVRYHSGIVEEDGKYGVNIDGDGQDGRLSGSPKIFWTQEQIIEFFANRGIELKPYV